PEAPLVPGEVRLQAIDLDGNGAIDVVVRTAAGGRAFLADDKGTFTDLGRPLPPGLTVVFKWDARAPLTLVGLEKRFDAKSSKGYHWLEMRPRGIAAIEGDNRVNSFGIGGEIEVRTGTLIVKQLIDQPSMMIGLGTRSRASLLRLVWTNGQAQIEFDRGV